MQKIFENWRHFVDNENNPTLLNEKKGIPNYEFKNGKFVPLKRKTKSWERKAFGRIKQYDDIITRIAEKTGLSKAFLYGTMYTESGGRTSSKDGGVFQGPVVSAFKGEGWQKRAQGPMQVYWPLARSAARRGVISQEDYESGKWRTDVETNMLVAASFIARQRDRYLSPKKAWKNESAEEAKRRSENVKNMSDAELENLLHVAYSHGQNHKITRRIMQKGYGGSGITSDSWKSAYNYPRKSQIAKDLLAEVEGTDEGEDIDTPNEKYVVIAGNSHSQAAKRHIEREYKLLEEETGTKYNIEYIGAPQGHGGEIKGQLARIKELSEKLKEKDAQIAAVIHVGTNFPKEHKFENLVKEYSKLTRNITVIGSPNPHSEHSGYNTRAKWNEWLKQNKGGLGINYVETWGRLEDNDVRDGGVHLTKSGYKKMMEEAFANMSQQDLEGTRQVAAPAEVKTPGSDAPSSDFPETEEYSAGKFVHGFAREEFPDFDFDKFYKELDEHFEDEGGAEGILEKYGKDFKFGREHHTAWEALQARKSEAPAETATDVDDESQSLEDLASQLPDLDTNIEAARTVKLGIQGAPAQVKAPQEIADNVAADYARAHERRRLAKGSRYITSTAEEEFINQLMKDDVPPGEYHDLPFESPSGQKYKRSIIKMPEEYIDIDLDDPDREYIAEPSYPQQIQALEPENRESALNQLKLHKLGVEPVVDVFNFQESMVKKIIKEEYKKLLFEQNARWQQGDLIKVDVGLSYGKEFSFYGNVLNQIRAIKGVTIAKADESGVIDVSPTRRSVLLHLKFMPDRPLSQYLYYLKSELIKIKDSSGDRIMNAETKNIPQKIEI